MWISTTWGRRGRRLVLLGAVLLGLVAAGFVALLAAFLTPFRRQETVA
jgi:hypothetical protein